MAVVSPRKECISIIKGSEIKVARVVVQKVVGEMLNCRWKVLLDNADTMM